MCTAKPKTTRSSIVTYNQFCAWVYARKVGHYEVIELVLVETGKDSKMADTEHRTKEDSTATSKETMVKQEKRENSLINGGKGSGDDADSLEELPLDIGEHYLVRRSDDSWRE